MILGDELDMLCPKCGQSGLVYNGNYFHEGPRGGICWALDTSAKERFMYDTTKPAGERRIANEQYDDLCLQLLESLIRSRRKRGDEKGARRACYYLPDYHPDKVWGDD